jgi:hypothetical protein
MFTIDECNADHICGWITGEKRSISVAVNGSAVGIATIGFPRPDVAKDYPNAPNAELSGFRYIFRNGELCPGKNNINISATSDDLKMEWENDIVGPVSPVSPVSLCTTPFPPGLTPVLVDLLGEAIATMNFLDDHVERQAIEAIVLAIHRGSRNDRSLWKYASYITRLWYQFAAIQQQFPKFNLLSPWIDDVKYAPYNAVDVLCIQTHPFSMLALASHLYVLKYHNLRGRVFEFGCFKGYSTCCISLACRELGLQLATFDSFEGLPGSGGFKGEFEEVKRNVVTYGAPEVVTFYPGFFSDSLRDLHREAVFSIFMDVDLEISAIDVAKVIPWMAPEGAVFSDETYPENFLAGKVAMEKSEAAVLPPILDAFSTLGRDVRGRHLYENVGALWGADGGIPVLSAAGLRSILSASLPQSLPEF